MALTIKVNAFYWKLHNPLIFHWFISFSEIFNITASDAGNLRILHLMKKREKNSPYITDC